MSKRSGIGAFLSVDGFVITSDIETVNLHGGPNLLPGTSIDMSAMARIPGLLDGGMDLGAFFDSTALASHAVLNTRPTGDSHLVYGIASTLGAAGAAIVGKRTDYGAARNADGSLMFTVPTAGNGYSLEWGNLLTAGVRTDTTGTNGTGVDGAASSSTGWAAYLQLGDMTGTNVIVTLQDSADNVSFATFTGSAFTSATADRTVQRIAGAAGATVRRYVRAVTSGTFSSAPFIVLFTRFPVVP